MPPAGEREAQFGRNDERERQAHRERERPDAVFAQEAEEVVHAVPSSSTSYRSTVPTPCTSIWVGVPKGTSSRTRSYTGLVTTMDVFCPSDWMRRARRTVSPQRS